MAQTYPGREDPRVTRTRSVVLDAAATLLAERGYAAFTMDALVERTGVSKTTMYKHWPSRTGLVAATVGAMATDPAAPDTGDVRSDLIALAMDSLDAYTGPRWSGLASVQEAAVHDPELRASLRAAVGTRFSAPRAVLERAVSAASCARNSTWTPPSRSSSEPSSSGSAAQTCRKSGTRSPPSSTPSWTASAPGRPDKPSRTPQ